MNRPTPRVLEAIDAASNPELQIFRCRKDGILRPQSLMIVDSEKVVIRAYQAGFQMKKLLVTPELHKKHEDVFSQQEDTKIFLASTSCMESIIGHRIHQGMIGIAQRPDSAELLDLPTPIVVLANVLDPENVGCIMRNACAFGFRSVLADESGCSPYYRRCVRVSMGAIFKLKVRTTKDLAGDLERLQTEKGVVLWSTGDSSLSSPLDRLVASQNSALIIGNESRGVSSKLMGIADGNIRIAISPAVDSLSASSASAVLLYEISKSWRSNLHL